MPAIEQKLRPIQVENGPRFAQQAEYKGQKIEVATGYDVGTDQWRYHVYLLAPGGERQKLGDEPTYSDSQNGAFAAGFNFAAGWLDHH